MTSVSAVLSELDSALVSQTEAQAASTTARVTDMFVSVAQACSDDQLGVFDVVIGRLAARVGARARLDLSERLADLERAPLGVIRQLALDDIAIARPVLTRSALLGEQDLIAVASEKGQDHMLAITERPHLSTNVTDYLVVKGDRVITHALASNLTALFSGRGMSLMVTRAISDEALQSALGERSDIPDPLKTNLSNAARDSARRRLMARPVPVALPVSQMPGDADLPGEADLRRAAVQMIEDMQATGKLTEAVLAGLAASGKTDHTILALSALAKISLSAAEQAISGSDRDACLVIGKAMNWNWTTIKALLGTRPAADQLPHLIDRARDNYEALSATTATRVLQFMRVKEQTGR
jgi:uncharacterized protein (DUF2336 family)